MHDDWLWMESVPEPEPEKELMELADVLTPEEVKELAQMALKNPETERIRQRLVLADIDRLLEEIARAGAKRSR